MLPVNLRWIVHLQCSGTRHSPGCRMSFMPCYHFVFHGYGTWLPDEDDGYVKRGEGKLPQDCLAAQAYRARMMQTEAMFEDEHQRALIDEAHVAAKHQRFRVHFVATEPTHVHLLVSWTDEQRTFEKLRASIRQSLSRRLSREYYKRQWLSEGGSRRRISCEDHLTYLVTTYLPEHSGWKWSEDKRLHR